MLYEKSLNPLFINIIRLSHPQASGKTLLRDTCLQMLLKMRMAQIKKACPQMLSVPRGAVPSWLSLFPKEIGRDQAILYAIPGAGWCRDTGVAVRPVLCLPERQLVCRYSYRFPEKTVIREWPTGSEAIVRRQQAQVCGKAHSCLFAKNMTMQNRRSAQRHSGEPAMGDKDGFILDWLRMSSVSRQN